MDGSLDLYLGGYKYDNCELAYTGLLAGAFEADIGLQAISGIGLTQNAGAAHPAEMGRLPMPDLFNRTLQMQELPLWDFTLNPRGFQPSPDFVMISLGGNDYNHQDGNVPSNFTFSTAMSAFLLDILQVYFPLPASPVIFSICGMGDPLESDYDPDNNRCNPCPHVSDAVNDFKLAQPQYASRVHYIYIPCDGSVVSGQGDIGCMGHKSRVGQAEVAAYLEPKVRAIMGW